MIETSSVFKKLPGYPIEMSDMHSNTLHVGDTVRIYYDVFNNERYATGVIAYDINKLSFYIHLDSPVSSTIIFSKKENKITRVYLSKIQTDEGILPFINDSSNLLKIKSSSKNIYNECYELYFKDIDKFHQRILDLEQSGEIELSKKELSYTLDKIKKPDLYFLGKNVVTDIKIMPPITFIESVYDFLGSNINQIVKQILTQISKEYEEKKNWYSGDYHLKNININWSYNILVNQSNMLSIELSERIS